MKAAVLHRYDPELRNKEFLVYEEIDDPPAPGPGGWRAPRRRPASRRARPRAPPRRRARRLPEGWVPVLAGRTGLESHATKGDSHCVHSVPTSRLA